MVTINVFTLTAQLLLSTSGFDKDLGNAETRLKNMGQNATQAGNALNTLFRPLQQFGKNMIDNARDFEHAMSGVIAVTKNGSQNLEALSNLATDISLDSSKTALEIAGAMEVLGRNGLTAEQILDGAAVAAVKLAEATGGNLALASDLATDVMLQFNKEASELPGIVDQITGATLNSKFSVQDYAYVIANAGGTMASLGGDFDELTVAVAATAAQFKSGRTAGDAFKNFILNLPGNSKEARAAIADLGLEFYDTNGNLKSMREIIAELQPHFQGLTKELEANNISLTNADGTLKDYEQLISELPNGVESLTEKQAAMAAKTIFGTNAIKTALALAATGVEGYDALAESIAKVDANDVAATRLDNLEGKIKRYESATEALGIQLKDYFLPVMSAVVESVTALVRWFANLPDPVQKVILAIGGVLAISGPVLVIFGQIATAVAALSGALPILGAAFTALTGPIGWVIAAVGALVLAFSTDFMGIRTKTIEVITDIKNWFANLDMLQLGKDMINGLINGITGMYGKAKETITGFGKNVIGWFKNAVGSNSPWQTTIQEGINMIKGLILGVSDAAVRAELEAELNRLGEEMVSATLDPYWKGLDELNLRAQFLGTPLENLQAQLGLTKTAFDDLIKMSLADGVVSDEERALLQQFADDIDLLESKIAALSKTVKDAPNIPANILGDLGQNYTAPKAGFPGSSQDSGGVYTPGITGPTTGGGMPSPGTRTPGVPNLVPALVELENEIEDIELRLLSLGNAISLAIDPTLTVASSMSVLTEPTSQVAQAISLMIQPVAEVTASIEYMKTSTNDFSSFTEYATQQLGTFGGALVEFAIEKLPFIGKAFQAGLEEIKDQAGRTIGYIFDPIKALTSLFFQLFESSKTFGTIIRTVNALMAPLVGILDALNPLFTGLGLVMGTLYNALSGLVYVVTFGRVDIGKVDLGQILGMPKDFGVDWNDQPTAPTPDPAPPPPTQTFDGFSNTTTQLPSGSTGVQIAIPGLTEAFMANIMAPLPKIEMNTATMSQALTGDLSSSMQSFFNRYEVLTSKLVSKVERMDQYLRKNSDYPALKGV